MSARIPDRTLREDAVRIFRGALQAVDPEQLVRRHMTVSGLRLRVCDIEFDLRKIHRLVVIGAGKGAGSMAKAAGEILGERISAGAVIVKYGQAAPPGDLETCEAGHPLPDENTLSGSRRIIELLQDLNGDDLVLVLLTGGASALLELPAEDVSLEDLRLTNQLLLSCAADIRAVNAVRKHLSKVKGGRLLSAASPARVVTLVISDVIGNAPDAIASGPTAPDPTTFADAWKVIERHSLQDKLPRPVLEHFQRGLAGKIPETIKPSDPRFARSDIRIIGDNRLLLGAAKNAARELGYETFILTDRMTGEARDAGRKLAGLLGSLKGSVAADKRRYCLLAGGETTVLLDNGGKGGRNQELALAAALELQGATGCLLLAAGSDGGDGPTDAAGAFADGLTAARGESISLNVREHLLRHDTYPFFERLGDLFITGPTGTNVMDLVVMLRI